MKSKDIAKNHGLNGKEFDNWLKQSEYAHQSARMGGLDVTDGQDIEVIVDSFRDYQPRNRDRLAQVKADRDAAAEREREAAEREREAAERAAQQKQEALAGMLITSGFTFDGYTITKYSGYISGDDAVQIDRSKSGFWGPQAVDVGAALMESLVKIRRTALAELKEAAYALGCNAVIGVDFDYLTLDPETASGSGGTLYLPYVFGVTANGNAVIIEKSGSAAPSSQL